MEKKTTLLLRLTLRRAGPTLKAGVFSFHSDCKLCSGGRDLQSAARLLIKKKKKKTSYLRSSEKNNLLAILKRRITRPLGAPDSLQLRPSARDHINIPHPGASLGRVTNSATAPTGSIKQRGGKNGDKCRQASECYLIRRTIRRRRGTTRVIWPPESSSDCNPSTAPSQTMMDGVRSCRTASRPLATGGGFLQKRLEESGSWRADCAVDLLRNRKRFFFIPPV